MATRPALRPLIIAIAAGSWFLAVPATADVVYLANGSRLVIDGWREEEDGALAFFVDGGTVWIAKSEVTKIEEGGPREAAAAPALDPVALAVPPPPAPPRVPRIRLEAADAVQRMRALLKHGEALFDDRFLSPAQKIRALAWLDARWREFDVADALRRVHERGQQALRLAAEAFAAVGAGIPDAAARAAEAAVAVRGAESELVEGMRP